MRHDVQQQIYIVEIVLLMLVMKHVTDEQIVIMQFVNVKMDLFQIEVDDVSLRFVVTDHYSIQMQTMYMKNVNQI
jgi:hypothetical protein